MNFVSDENLDLSDIAKLLLAALDPRSKDVVTRRYGIVDVDKAETLESIGQEYGITRERVRQIQSQAKKNLQAINETLEPVALFFTRIFTDHGGILAEEHLVTLVQERLPRPTSANLVNFYLDVLPPYTYVIRDKHFAPHWRHPKIVPDHAATVVEVASKILQKSGHPVDEEALLAAVLTELTANEITPPDAHVMAHLIASKDIQKTPFSQWGLADWAETSPRGVGDKAYVVLRRNGKPQHFTAITQMINEANFDHRQANPQTVHNELIKDARFVLVGRGLYGLVEWGYMAGTVSDVIESLLKKAAEPLTREEVVERVLEQRHVKKNTILLGLQNQSRFQRTPDQRYTLRQADNS